MGVIDVPSKKLKGLDPIWQDELTSRLPSISPVSQMLEGLPPKRGGQFFSFWLGLSCQASLPGLPKKNKKKRNTTTKKTKKKKKQAPDAHV